jgi:Proprotein convertase P-domain
MYVSTIRSACSIAVLLTLAGIASAASETIVPSSVTLRDLEPLATSVPSRASHRPEVTPTPAERDRRAREQDLALRQPPSAGVIQTWDAHGPAQILAVPSGINVGSGFDGPDISQCCTSGLTAPPDPDIAVGNFQLIVAANNVFRVFDKQGVALSAPIDFETFFQSQAANGCVRNFPANLIYDPIADRYLIGMNANGDTWCVAASQSNDATGAWNLYAIPITGVNEFYDFAHAAVGNQALYAGFNVRDGSTRAFIAGRLFAIDKSRLYQGLTLTLPPHRDIPESGPWPVSIHGAAPVGSNHYFLAGNTGDGNSYGVWLWSDPTGVAAPSRIGTANLQGATGVSASVPLGQPQLGTAQVLSGNDFSVLDAEWVSGKIWMAHNLSCNPGAGAVNCVRWAQIDASNASVTQAGVLSFAGAHIAYPSLAVDGSGNMAIGFTVSGPSKYAGLYASGRLASDTLSTLRTPVLVRSGQAPYRAFDSMIALWGDYSALVPDPDGQRLWFYGEYSKALASDANWGTWVAPLRLGALDAIFANGFEQPALALELHALTNQEEADAAPGPPVIVGDNVTWRYVLRNTGQIRINSIVVNDDHLGAISCPAAQLDGGADMLCTDVAGLAGNSDYANLASATGTAADGRPVAISNPSHYGGFDPNQGLRCADAPGTGCSQSIPDGAGVAVSNLPKSGCATVTGVRLGLSITHPNIGDLKVTLTNPANLSVDLINRPANATGNCSGDNILVLFDDAALGANANTQCHGTQPAMFGRLQPVNPLAAFNGGGGSGTWKLSVRDMASGETGSLNGWSLSLSCN